MHNIYSMIKIDGTIYPQVKEIYLSPEKCYIVYTKAVSENIYEDVTLYFSNLVPIEIVLNERK